MIALESGHYRLTVDPAHGATILTATWRDEMGVQQILEPLTSPETGLKAGSFVMAPFANRIDHGRFSFGGKDFQIPVNNPTEDMAIHGYARNRVWQVAEQTADRVRLQLDFNEPALPWRFLLTQDITLGDDGILVGLAITNRGDKPMPFGFGLHPWFPKPQDARLIFHASGAHLRDPRGLPLPDLAPVPGLSADDTQPLRQMPRLDASFSGWTPRRALLLWPGFEVELVAQGALRHLHVFNPDDREVFCAEPVSHLPDAVNRPRLAADAQMTVLAPDETMTGTMHLKARRN